MNRATHALNLLAVLAIGLGSCRTSESGAASATSSASAPGAARDGLLPMPSGPLELSMSGGPGLSLDALLTRLSQLTGVTYSAVPATKARLGAAMVALSQDQRIPAAEVYPWVESLLQQNGFALAVLENAGAPLVGVYSGAERPLDPPAIHVDAAQLEECRMHPAIQFSTVLTLPNTDVRSLGNSLRILSPDSMSGGVIPAGTTSSVILSGSGRNVTELAGLLMRIEAEGKKKNEQAADSAAAQKP